MVADIGSFSVELLGADPYQSLLGYAPIPVALLHGAEEQPISFQRVSPGPNGRSSSRNVFLVSYDARNALAIDADFSSAQRAQRTQSRHQGLGRENCAQMRRASRDFESVAQDFDGDVGQKAVATGLNGSSNAE